jgi:cation diffusion facilitator CzcD-associated flavoprotein CzcO
VNGESAARPVRVAIVGSGFGGLGAAIRLPQDGVDDFVILERRSWYLDRTGRNSTLWPHSTWSYYRRASAFDPKGYVATAAPAAAAHAG